MLRPKSIFRWIREGDVNSRFFHSVMNQRYIRNLILILNFEKGKLDHVADINEEIKNHFQEIFKESSFCKPTLRGVIQTLK